MSRTCCGKFRPSVRGSGNDGGSLGTSGPRKVYESLPRLGSSLRVRRSSARASVRRSGGRNDMTTTRHATNPSDTLRVGASTDIRSGLNVGCFKRRVRGPRCLSTSSRPSSVASSTYGSSRWRPRLCCRIPPPTSGRRGTDASAKSSHTRRTGLGGRPNSVSPRGSYARGNTPRRRGGLHGYGFNVCSAQVNSFARGFSHASDPRRAHFRTHFLPNTPKITSHKTTHGPSSSGRS